MSKFDWDRVNLENADRRHREAEVRKDAEEWIRTDRSKVRRKSSRRRSDNLRAEVDGTPGDWISCQDCRCRIPSYLMKIHLRVVHSKVASEPIPAVKKMREKKTGKQPPVRLPPEQVIRTSKKNVRRQAKQNAKTLGVDILHTPITQPLAETLARLIRKGNSTVRVIQAKVGERNGRVGVIKCPTKNSRSVSQSLFCSQLVSPGLAPFSIWLG